MNKASPPTIVIHTGETLHRLKRKRALNTHGTTPRENATRQMHRGSGGHVIPSHSWLSTGQPSRCDDYGVKHSSRPPYHPYAPARVDTGVKTTSIAQQRARPHALTQLVLQRPAHGGASSRSRSVPIRHPLLEPRVRKDAQLEISYCTA